LWSRGRLALFFTHIFPHHFDSPESSAYVESVDEVASGCGVESFPDSVILVEDVGSGCGVGAAWLFSSLIFIFPPFIDTGF
jgi:hypothetical protein